MWRVFGIRIPPTVNCQSDGRFTGEEMFPENSADTVWISGPENSVSILWRYRINKVVYNKNDTVFSKTKDLVSLFRCIHVGSCVCLSFFLIWQQIYLWYSFLTQRTISWKMSGLCSRPESLLSETPHVKKPVLHTLFYSTALMQNLNSVQRGGDGLQIGFVKGKNKKKIELNLSISPLTRQEN